MTDEELSAETGTGVSPGPLVAVTFQKDPLRKQKYLESEPKALGLTQIGLSVFQIVSWGFFVVAGMAHSMEVIAGIIGCVLAIIAGILALAAQTLHLPTLKACLGMQVVACVVSIFILFMLAAEQGDNHMAYMCWHSEEYFNVTHGKNICNSFTDAFSHFNAERILIEVVLVAISATLVAYCCKVINCCSPSSRMPVITVQAPTAQPRETSPAPPETNQEI